MKIQQQADYYNSRWSRVNYQNSHGLARAVAILDALRDTNLSEPEICDLGCGTGWLSSMLGCFGPTTAVDLSDLAVSNAARKYPHVKFVCADALQWRHPSESFDIVVSQEVLEHFENHDAYLATAHRLLRKGGYLILTTPNATTVRARDESKWSDQPIENWLTRRDLTRAASKYFRDLHVSTVISAGSKGPHRIVNSAKLRTALEFLGLQRRWEQRALQMGFGLHLIVIGRKA